MTRRRLVEGAAGLGALAAGAAVFRLWTADGVSEETLVLWALPALVPGVLACAFCVSVLEARSGHRLATRLRALESSATALFSAIPDALLVVEDERIVTANGSMCALVGVDRDELVGETEPFRFWPAEHAHAIEEWRAELVRSGEAAAELVVCDATGERIPVEAAGRTLAGAGGAVRHVVSIRSVAERRRAHDRGLELATRDPVTSLLNARGFEDRLVEEIGRSRLAESNVSLALLELGLGVEDETEAETRLVTAADHLRRLVRAGEQIGRTGPRELGWIMPGTDATSAVEAVGRARRALGAADGGTSWVTITAGVCDLEQAHDWLTLYAFADRALDLARRQLAGTTTRFQGAEAAVRLRQSVDQRHRAAPRAPAPIGTGLRPSGGRPNVAAGAARRLPG